MKKLKEILNKLKEQEQNIQEQNIRDMANDVIDVVNSIMKRMGYRYVVHSLLMSFKTVIIFYEISEGLRGKLYYMVTIEFDSKNVYVMVVLKPKLRREIIGNVAIIDMRACEAYEKSYKIEKTIKNSNELNLIFAKYKL